MELLGLFWAVFAVPHSKRHLVKAFGHVIRETRIQAKMTQEQLSFRAGVHRTYVSDLERGLKSPTLDVIESLATALGTEPHALLEVAERLQAAKPQSGKILRKRFRT